MKERKEKEFRIPGSKKIQSMIKSFSATEKVIFGFFVFGQISVFAQTSPTDAYCQSVSICGSAPKEFTMMLEFTQEMLNAIKTQ